MGRLRMVWGILCVLAGLSGYHSAHAGEAEAGQDAPKPAEVKKETADPAQPPAAEPKTIEVTVTAVATKSEADPYEVPAMVETYDRQKMDRKSFTNFVDVFREMPGVFVQKTGQGQGSPFIRGYTAYRNVLLIDGVRFNNATFRSGPNQYWATIDQLFVDRVDVLRGPGSNLYGSDAVGGVVNVLTKSPSTWSDGLEWGGEAYSRVGLAEQARVGHVEFEGSYKDKVGWIFGGSFKDYDDFEGGHDTGTVKESSYQEAAWNAKVQYRPLQDHEFTFYYDFFDQGDSPRTEQTVFAKPFHGSGVGTDLRRDLDQERQLGYVRYAVKNIDSFVDEVSVTGSWQKVKEQQHRKRISGGTTRREQAGFQDDILGAQFQAKSETPIGEMTYGLDFYHEDIQSKAVNFNQGTGVATKPIQGPVGDNAHQTTTGVYIQDEKDLFDGMLTLIAGGRFEYIDIDIGRAQDPDNANGAIGVDVDYKSLVGSFKAMIRPDHGRGDHWHVYLGVSQAFRAPNVRDLSGGESSNSFSIVLPGPVSKEPEEYLTPEIGLKMRYPKVSWEIAYFETMANGELGTAPTGMVDPNDGRPIFARTLGAGKGWIKGIETSLSWNFYENFNFWGNLTWTEGETDQFDADMNIYRKPADRIIPVMSHFGVVYESKVNHWWAEIHADIATDADRLSLGNRTDTRRIPPNGTPGYGVFGLRGGVKLLDDRLNIIAALDNVTNADYRVHGSGQNMPGTNFSLTVRFRW